MTTPAESVKIEGMSLDEFIQRYEAAPFELIDGEIIEMSPTISEHLYISDNIKMLFTDHARPLKLGRAFTEATYVLPGTLKKDWVKGSRVPDVVFYLAERLAEYKANNPKSGKAPLALVPDIVVEVISPNDSYTKVTEKVNLFLQDGVKLILVVDPDKRTLIVNAPGQQAVILTEKDTMTGGDVLPNFSAKVGQVFED